MTILFITGGLLDINIKYDVSRHNNWPYLFGELCTRGGPSLRSLSGREINRLTRGHDRRKDRVTLDEVVKINIRGKAANTSES